MKRTNVAGMKIELLVELRKVPTGLQWVGNIPSAYSINVLENDSRTRTIICCSDSFGGGIAYAKYEGRIELEGKDYPVVLDHDEREYLKMNYPVLLQEIESFLV